MIDVVSKRVWFFVVSTLAILPGMISLLLPGRSLSTSATTLLVVWEARAARQAARRGERAVRAECPGPLITPGSRAQN